MAAFAKDHHQVRCRARQSGVAMCVYPAVNHHHFTRVHHFAYLYQDAYALGIHPLYILQAKMSNLDTLEKILHQKKLEDLPKRLVAIGEIGLDFFLPQSQTQSFKQKQMDFLVTQLQLAERYQLPVILHTRQAVDQVTQLCRRYHTRGGIAHAFSGSLQQAKALINLGFKLGFGGAMTFARALRLRGLAQHLPIDTLVLETDAPYMPPQWLYVNVNDRKAGIPQSRNTPESIPQIAKVLADLRKIKIEVLQQALWSNTLTALPRLSCLI
jgi:TatD DNase family protein